MTVIDAFKKQWEYCGTRFRQNRMPNAFLFFGDIVTDIFSFSQNFAQFVLCEAPAKKEKSCRHCVSCKLFEAQTHPDYFALWPLSQEAITVDEIRSLSEHLAKTPFRAHCQIVLLLATAMNFSASNALLKTLEEPSGEVLFILVATASHLLPQTILSRCQKLFFGTNTMLKAPSLFLEEITHIEKNRQVKAETIQKWLTQYAIGDILCWLLYFVMEKIRSEKFQSNKGELKKLFSLYDELIFLKKTQTQKIHLNYVLQLETILENELFET